MSQTKFIGGEQTGVMCFSGYVQLVSARQLSYNNILGLQTW